VPQERNAARTRITQSFVELAHAARVSLLEQRFAPIACEVNQPVTAIVNYARSATMWLMRQESNLGEVAACLTRIVMSGDRTTNVIKRVKILANKCVALAENFSPSEITEDAFGVREP
jgi:C4-dicarboxylate-specific signal transduction histidine kinase